MKRCFSLLAALTVVLSPAVFSQTFSESYAPLVGGGLNAPSDVTLPDCSAGTEITADAIAGAFTVGQTASTAGGSFEIGQSFTATCAGTIVSVDIILQNGTNVEVPAQDINFDLVLFQGAGTAGTLLSTSPTTLTLPAAGAAAVYTVPFSGNTQLDEDGVYTFFLDVTSQPNFGIQATNAGVYAGGVLYQSTTGSAAGATERTGFELAFTIILDPPMSTAGESFEERGFSLSTARPNPATGTSRFDLAVATPQDVRVAAYDALGRQVAVLLDGTVSDTKTVTLDAASLAPGIYIVRAVGATFATTQTVTVTR